MITFVLLLIVLVLLASSIVYLILRRVSFSSKLSGVLSISIIGFSLFAYPQWGGIQQLRERVECRKIDACLEQLAQQSITPEKVKTALDEIALQVRHSHFALAKLAAVYTELRFYDQAMECYSQALQIVPHQIDYQLQWLAVDSMAHQGRLSENALQVAERLLSQQTSQNTVMNLLAIHDYVNFNYENALSRWQYLLNEDDSLTAQKRQVLQKAILSAEEKIGKTTQNRFAYRVVLTVSEPLKQVISKEDIVFIYLKSDAMPYPIAAIRVSAAKWPLEVEIDNKDVMISVKDLSAVKKVKIFAKISKTGNALDTQSDLLAESEEIDFAVYAQPVRIKLDKS